MPDVAFAGAGWIAAVHALAVPAAGGRLVAVASRTESSATRLVAEAGGSVVGYADLPADADVVVVATPPAHHTEHALRAAAGGAAVLIEKPLATTLADADRLVRVAEAGAPLTYAENLLFAPAVSFALTEIAMLGPLTHLSARAMQARPTWGDFTSRGAGGGVCFDLGVHPLALVLRAAGSARPVAVRATFHGADDIDVEDRASLALRFDTGLDATIEVSWREDSPTWDLQAAAPGQVAYLELLPQLGFERNGEPVDLPAPAEGEHPPQLEEFGYLDQLRSTFAAADRGAGAAESTVAFGRDILDIVCAASQSAATGTEVALPFEGPRDRTPVELWRPSP